MPSTVGTNGGRFAVHERCGAAGRSQKPKFLGRSIWSRLSVPSKSWVNHDPEHSLTLPNTLARRPATVGSLSERDGAISWTGNGWQQGGDAVAMLHRLVAASRAITRRPRVCQAGVGPGRPVRRDKDRRNERYEVRREIQGQDLAMTNPDKWFYDVVQPAMEKADIKSQQDQASPMRLTITAAHLIC